MSQSTDLQQVETTQQTIQVGLLGIAQRPATNTPLQSLSMNVFRSSVSVRWGRLAKMRIWTKRYRHWRTTTCERRWLCRPGSQRRDLQPQGATQELEDSIPLQDTLGLRGHNTIGRSTCVAVGKKGGPDSNGSTKSMDSMRQSSLTACSHGSSTTRSKTGLLRPGILLESRHSTLADRVRHQEPSSLHPSSSACTQSATTLKHSHLDTSMTRKRTSSRGTTHQNG